MQGANKSQGVPGRAAKDALFDAFAEVARALANGRRAEIIDVLAQGERSVDDLAALPKDLDIVAYCRGPYCAYADDAVRELQRRGYSARRLEDGYPEWRRAGLPVRSAVDPA
jgi:rhodanese-related sulfurtransferase